MDSTGGSNFSKCTLAFVALFISFFDGIVMFEASIKCAR